MREAVFKGPTGAVAAGSGSSPGAVDTEHVGLGSRSTSLAVAQGEHSTLWPNTSLKVYQSENVCDRDQTS